MAPHHRHGAGQNRARAARLRMLKDEKPVRTPRTTPTPTRRSSPHHHRFRHQQDVALAEENVKIVEVDTGSSCGGFEAHGTPHTSSRRSSYYAKPLCRTPSKNELYQKISPTPSAVTDANARTYSGCYERGEREGEEIVAGGSGPRQYAVDSRADICTREEKIRSWDK